MAVFEGKNSSIKILINDIMKDDDWWISRIWCTPAVLVRCDYTSLYKRSCLSVHPSLHRFIVSDSALWSRMTKHPDLSDGPLAFLFAFPLSLLTFSLAPHCLFHLHASLCSFVCLLAHFPACGKVNDYGWDVRLSHSRMETEESSLASTISNNNNNYKVVVSYK